METYYMNTHVIHDNKAMADKAKTTVVEYLAQGFDKQEDCDVMFTVDGKTIGAHKSLLQIMKARCQGLCDMVMEWKSGDAPISIDNMDFNSFRILLRYVYSDEIAISNENVFIFLSAAIQWKMSGLEELCVDYLSECLQLKNVCYYMNEAVNFQSTALQEKCRQVFFFSTLDAAKDDSFLKLSKPALSAFLDTEYTDIPEIVLFFFIRKWMEYQCQDQHLPINGSNMRRVIGDALYKIHFPTMTVQDFANSVTTIKGLLTDTEMAQVFQMITVFDNKELECPFPCKFRCLWNPSANFHEANKVCNAKLVSVFYSETLCDLASVLEHAASAKDGESVSLTSFCILVQCWADLLNSTSLTGTTPDNKDIRKELHREFCILKELGKNRKSQEAMTKFMEFRNKLNEIWGWL